MGKSFPQLLFVLLVGLAIIAAIDYFWQRHIFIQGLRMTKQEIKDEFKQTEGSPEVKEAKIRRKQMEASAMLQNKHQLLMMLKMQQLS